MIEAKRTPPYNTGKVLIGRCYIPQQSGWQSNDADIIQALLLQKPEAKRQHWWRWLKQKLTGK